MQSPGFPSLFFLFYLLVLLPWLAFRSARRIAAIKEAREARAAQQARPGNGEAGVEAGAAPDASSPASAAGPGLPSRESIWLGTIFSLVLLFFLAWVTGRSFGYEIFAVPNGLRIGDLLAAGAALAFVLAIREVSRRLRSEVERRRMTVYLLAPRTARERALRTAAVIAAAISEEAAYRGVGMSILWYMTGSAALAALVCAVAFALAHALQGWKSAAVIFLFALVLHALVMYTTTLVFAMIVHGLYDFIAGRRIERDARRYHPEPSGMVA